MAIKAIINNTEKEIEQIKNSDEQDIDYVYSRIGDTEVEGEPPISIKSIGGNLADYRIYGNTVDGESVGDRTGNLFDGIFLQGCWLGSDGSFQASSKWICTQKMPCKANTDYTFTFGIKSRWYGFAWYDIDGNYIESNGSTIERQSNIFTAISSANAAFMAVNIAGDHIGTAPLDIHPSDVTDFMLVEGSTPLPYEPYGYRVPVTVSNGTDTLTTPIYLPEPLRKVGDEAEYIDYGEQKLHRVRKNLLQNQAVDREIEGVTFTVNSDGSITCNGTASDNTNSGSISSSSLPAGSYYLNGTPSGGSLSTYYMYVACYTESEIILYNDVGDGVSFTIDNSCNINVRIAIKSGCTCNNLTFYPMIRKADITDDTYEPYIVNTEVNTNLPALSTIKGTNTFSVNTSIQPSNIYIKDSFDYKRIFTATRTIEGESPLNYRSIEDSDSALSNYRIYGNTVGGESVGDKTENLFDGELVQGYYSDTAGSSNNLISSTLRVGT